MRLRGFLSAWAVGLWSASAAAQTVTPIPRTPPVAQPAQAPAMQPAAELGDLLGKPVTRVAVVLEGNIWDDVDVPPVRTVKPGEPLTAALARRALDELLASGSFARGRVVATPEGSGALVVVRVVPRKLVTRIQLDLHGMRIDREELLAAADLSEGGEIVSTELGDAIARMGRVCASHGYPSAHVGVQTRDTDDPTRTLVLVDVQPGDARLVQDRQFYVFGAAADELAPATRAYGVRPGDRADESNVDSADAALEQAVHALGWYRAVVTHDLVLVSGDAAKPRVVLRVRVDSGPHQVATFEGNEHYDASTLEAALGLEKETDRSPGHLADKLRAFYEKRGFLDTEVRAEVRGADADPVQVMVFHIVEHRRSRVVARRYPCLKLDAIRHLSGGGPRTPPEIGTQIESYLEEELPGTELAVDPDPSGVSDAFGPGGGPLPTGARAVPLELHPDTTFVPDTYDRATQHVQELYRNEGFLHAQVGPVQVVRARCDPRSPPNRCAPEPLARQAESLCTYDPAGLPLPVEPLGPSLACRPDPAHGVECSPAIEVVIPIKLGPRTQLWDVGFTGVHTATEKEVAEAAEVPVGEYVSTTKLDDARRRILDWYKERGYAYADVKYTLEPSLDNTRARARFDVAEGDRVIVSGIVIRGLDATQESTARRRVALEIGQPYRTSDVRKTQERLATLGVFASIQVGLVDAFVPAPRKTVVIDVVERDPQYVEVRPGFSTGEGLRGAFEYGHRNLFGWAWSVTVHAQASYLPDFLILDPQVAANYRPLSTADRVATRETVTLAWPEMGLGPTVRSQVDGIYVRDLERDFTLVKEAVVGTGIWRPVRQLQVSGGPSFENNDVFLFQGGQISQYLNQPSNQGNSELARLLRVPDGASNVVAGKVAVTWDRRDAPFNAHSGTYFAASVEEVNSYPVAGSTADPSSQFESHFLRLTQTLAAYFPITPTVALATEVRLGEIANVATCMPLKTTTSSGAALAPPTYCTYPDRQFYMGGFDSMRGWLQDAFIPQELADQIDAGKLVCTSQSNCPIPPRGGNFMVNPRVELRFPVRAPVDGALFTDFGNLWNDPSYIFQHGFAMRADVGLGLRVQTPVGPLVFDYGFNLTRKSYEDLGAFHFAIGLF